MAHSGRPAHATSCSPGSVSVGKRRLASTEGRPLQLGRRGYLWLTEGTLKPFAILGALALLTGLYSLGDKSIWYDESISVYLAQIPLAKLVTFFWSDRPSTPLASNMMAYHVPLHFWAKLGTSEVMLRLPSVAAAGLAAPLVFLIGRRVLGTAVGFLAGVLFALHSLRVEYAQEVRTYALLLLLSVGATYLFLRAVEDDKRRTWVAYAFVAAAAAYAHVFGGFVVLAHAVTLFWRRPQSMRRVVAAFALAGVLVVPLLAAVVIQSGNFNGPGPLTVKSVVATSIGMTGRSQVGGGVPLALLYAGLVGIAVGAAVKSRPTAEARGGFAFVASWFAVPCAGLLAAALVRDVVVTRYFLMAVPPLTLLAAAGIVQIRHHWTRLAVTALAVLLTADGLVHWYGWTDRHPDNRASAAFVASQYQPTDRFIFVRSWTWRPFEYYLEAADKGRFSRWAGREAQLVDQAASRGRRIWLITSHVQFAPPAKPVKRVQSLLSAHYALAGTWEFPRLQVQLYQPEPSGSDP